jgi:hypothetical protein
LRQIQQVSSLNQIGRKKKQRKQKGNMDDDIGQEIAVGAEEF